MASPSRAARPVRRLLFVFLLTVVPAIVVIFVLNAFSAPGEVGRAAGAVRITEGLGARTVVDVPRVRGEDGETALQLVRRAAAGPVRAEPVATLPAAVRGPVDALVRRGAVDDRWRVWVNGVRARPDAPLRPGDAVWFDRAPAAGTPDSPAVVGAWPEPFRRGFGGDRYPSRVECTDPASRACTEARRALAAYDLPVAATSLRATDAANTLRLVVGPWRAIRADPAARAVERGPAVSGAFARPTADGARIALLDAGGRPVRDLAPGGGLVLAVRGADEPPSLLVTGVDEAGVRAALRGLRPEILAGRLGTAVEGLRSTGVPVRR